MTDMAKAKTAVIMVGLPARRKTFLSLRLHRYLEWQGYRVRIFNAGAYRRDTLGLDTGRSDFFDPRVERFVKEREKIAKRCFSDLTDWLRAAGDIAVYDATNVTPARREYLSGECLANGFDYVFVENIAQDPGALAKVMDAKLKNSADYKNSDMESAREDFRRRIAHYERVYETVSPAFPYVKVFNFGEKTEKNLGAGNALLEEIAEFLGSVNLAVKDVYITRHGETSFNLEDRIGGDSPLTGKGLEFAGRLKVFFQGRDLVVFTSGKLRAVESAGPIEGMKLELEELNEISSGVCDGMSYGEIASRYPEICGSRKRDKFNFRYPRGESYRDLIQRVKKAVVKIESRRKDVLVIAHRAVNRCLFSYFIPTPQEEIPYIDMPLDRVMKIRPQRALYDYEVLSV